jgi:hypothetical protein
MFFRIIELVAGGLEVRPGRKAGNPPGPHEVLIWESEASGQEEALRKAAEADPRPCACREHRFFLISANACVPTVGLSVSFQDTGVAVFRRLNKGFLPVLVDAPIHENFETATIPTSRSQLCSRNSRSWRAVCRKIR